MATRISNEPKKPNPDTGNYARGQKAKAKREGEERRKMFTQMQKAGSTVRQIGKFIPGRVGKAFQAAGSMATTVGTLGKILFNHPEWRENTDIVTKNAMPIGLNTALDKADPIDGFSPSLSPALVSSYRVSLMTFGAGTNTRTMWETTNRATYMALTANSGRVRNYKPVDIGKYNHNYRVLVAMLAHATRAWITGFVSTSEDTSIPDSLMYAFGAKRSDWSKNAGDIRDYLKEAWLRLSKYPVDAPVVDQALWAFSSVFADYDGPKPTYIVLSPCQPIMLLSDAAIVPDSTFYLGGNTAQLVREAGSTWEQVRADIEAYFDAFESQITNTDLYADMLRMVGTSHAIDIANTVIAKLNEAVPSLTYVVDPYMQRQLKNATPLSIDYYDQYGKKAKSSFKHTINYTTGQIEPIGLVRDIPRGTEEYEANYPKSLSSVIGNHSTYGHYIDTFDVDLSRVGENLSLTAYTTPMTAFLTLDTSHPAVNPPWMIELRLLSAETLVVVSAHVIAATDRSQGSVFVTMSAPGISYWCEPKGTVPSGNSGYSALMTRFFNGLALESQINEHHMQMVWTCYASPNLNYAPIREYSTFWDFAEYAVADTNNMRARHKLAISSLWSPTSFKIQEADQSTDFKRNNKHK